MTDWKNRKVFISGGSGVIGTALVNSLTKRGASVFVGDLKPCPAGWEKIGRYREGDLLTLKKSEIESFGPEVFFHLAATFERTEESYDFFGENFHHNISLSHHLLSLLKDLPSLKKIIFASSYLVYDPSLYLHPSPQNAAGKLVEISPLRPRNLCGMAKLQHEEELNFIRHYQPSLQTVYARIFRSYGKDSRDIISRWIRSVLRHEKIAVFRPEGRFDFVFAEDVAEGLRLLAESEFNGAVNIGSGRSRPIGEVLDVLQKQIGPLKMEQKSSDIPYEASEASLELFNHITAGKMKFRSIEEVIPLLIAHEQENIKKGR